MHRTFNKVCLNVCISMIAYHIVLQIYKHLYDSSMLINAQALIFNSFYVHSNETCPRSLFIWDF